MMSVSNRRIEVAQMKINHLHSAVFTEKDLRGLSYAEKEFIRNNGMHVEVTCDNQVYYMFIHRDECTRRKRLYALSKTQSIFPNDLFLKTGHYNYQCWLTFTKRGFNPYCYEYKFTTTLI